jgi:hypothetical protein
MIYIPIFFSGRSGSTVLFQLLDQHPNIICLNEIFNDEKFQDENLDLNYKSFIYKINQHNLSYKNNVKYIIFEFSYNDMKVFKNIDINKFTSFFNKNFLKVITPRRKNILKQIVSFDKAQQTNIWHTNKDRNKNGPFNFDIKMNNHSYDYNNFLISNKLKIYNENFYLKDFMFNFSQEQELIFSGMKNNSESVLELFYEDHIEENPIIAASLITDYLNLPRYENYKIGLVKIGKGLQNDLKNYVEMHDHLKNTSFEWMVH